MNWDSFIYFAIPSIVLWNIGAIIAQCFKSKQVLINTLLISGIAIFGIFITLIWLSLERPPLRTMGETRLWYSFLLAIVGYFIYLKWRIAPMLLYSTIMASVFATINIVRPEIHDQTLMPALQSIWFVPHVITYMFAYGVLGAVFLAVCYISIKKEKNCEYTPMIQILVKYGVGLLIIGMLIGALWAKEAWGNFWGWDAKESWALITAFVYLIYIHTSKNKYNTTILERWILIVGFIVLQICWYGVKYFPAALSSLHTYNT